MSERWLFKHRQEWIAHMVRIYGFINREHLEKKFEISTPQAFSDLRNFQTKNPGVLDYNKSAKRYEDAGPRAAYEALLSRLQGLCTEFGCLGGENQLDWLRSRLTHLKHLENLEAHPLLATCAKCGGSGFSGRGSGYDDVCDECGGTRVMA